MDELGNFIFGFIFGLILIAAMVLPAYCALDALKLAATMDLAEHGITYQEKGKWLKFSNSDVWCRPSKEYSEHAEICRENPEDEIVK